MTPLYPRNEKGLWSYLYVNVLQVEGEIAEMAAKYKERAAERAARRRLRKAGQMREPTSDEVDEELPTAPEMSELVIGKPPPTSMHPRWHFLFGPVCQFSMSRRSRVVLCVM